jgi:hypothetical protein
MADFKADLKEVLTLAAQIIRTRVELQVPVKTGKLKNSIQLVIQDDQIFINYDNYGVFTNYGTGPYYNGRYGMSAIPGSFSRYQKGKGGIRAQNWSAITIEEDVRIDQIINEEYNRQVDRFLDKQIQDI